MYKFPASVCISVVLTLALSLFSLSKRYAVERGNLAVTIVAETEQIELLAASEGLKYEQAVEKLGAAGLGGLVVSEQTVGELVLNRELFDLTNPRSDRSKHRSEYAADDPSFLEGIARSLNLRFGPVAETNIKYLSVALPAHLIRNASAGIPAVRIPPNYTGEVVVRLSNPPGNSEAYVRGMIAEIAGVKARYFLPAGDQVLGRKSNMKALTEALALHQIYYVSPEFAKIGGDESVIARIPERTVRLHTAQAAELDKVSESGAIERYAKAATERNIRLLLVRPLTYSSPKPLSDFGAFIQRLKTQLAKEGLTLKAPHPYENPDVPQWLFPALGLAIMPTVAYLLSLAGLGRNGLIVGGALLALAGIGCWFDAPRNVVALLGSLAFPTVALLGLRGPKSMPLAAAFFATAGLSLVGGMAVAAMLNGLPYMIRADQFSGVKAAHFAPIALVAVMLPMMHLDWKKALGQPVTWVQVALGAVLLVGLAFMASRTGNDNPAGVSGIELQFRSLLEQFLVVRPRTKEMLIGYPALVVGLGLWLGCLSGKYDQERCIGWAALLLGVGMIGLTSLVNTLCHLHTPLTIGLARTAAGLIIGGTLGAVLWLAVRSRLPHGRSLGD